MESPIWRKGLFFDIGSGPGQKGARFGIGSYFGPTHHGESCLHHREGCAPELRFYERWIPLNGAQIDYFRKQLSFWIEINKNWDKILEELGC